MVAPIVEGPAILRVGERSPKDKKFATDEFVYAAPGSIVAPRPHDMEPTMENAIAALLTTAVKAFGASRGKSAATKPAGAQGGYVVQQGDTLWSIAQRLLGSGARWRELLGPSGLPENFNPGGLSPGTVINLPGGAPGAAAPPVATEAPIAAATPAPATAGSPGEVFAGSQFLQDLLGKLLTDDVGRLGIPQLQQNIFESLGFVAPSLYGMTDPAEFRKGLEGVLQGSVGYVPTEAAKSAFRGVLSPLEQAGATITRGSTAGTVPSAAPGYNDVTVPFPHLGAKSADLASLTDINQYTNTGTAGPTAPPTFQTLASKVNLAKDIIEALGGAFSNKGRTPTYGIG